MAKCVAIVSIIAVGLTLGCAADRHAREIAHRLTGQVVAYESLVDVKVSSEQAFYRDQLERLRRTIGGRADIDPGSAAVGPGDAVKKTLLYGRLRVSAERDARMIAGAIVVGEPARAMATVVGYLVEGVGQDQQFHASVLNRQRQLSEALLVSLEKINQQKVRLRTVREGLIKLASEADIGAQLVLLGEMAEAVRQQVGSEATPKK